MFPNVSHAQLCVIPKELFQKEKVVDYWSALFDAPILRENLGIDDLDNCVLLYPNSHGTVFRHIVSFMYHEMKEKFPNYPHAICMNLHENALNFLAVNDHHIVYAGHFECSTNEDILYHLSNISQHFFQNISKINYFYKQLPHPVLRLLRSYYDMNEL
ncbi:MAG: DUF3822 family protein [Firmicutes bacterium]|nr:DUF3822 family protein [Bacillota bacterium]